MRNRGRIGKAVLLLASLAGCGSQGEQSEEPGATMTTGETRVATATDAPPSAFAQCSACHSVRPGVNGIGPSLHGVTGRKAAAVPGFAYSAALRNSSLTWDETGLDKWLEAPMAMIPGNRMSFAGVKDPAKRREVIEYLATLK